MNREENISGQLRILYKLDRAIDDTAKEIVSELKKDSTTYTEVDGKLKLLKKTVNYNHSDRQKYEHLFNIIESLLEQEKNDLPLTNRSK